MLTEYRDVVKTKFAYLWVSQILSQVTIHMMNFLLLTRLYGVTGSSIAVSFLWIAYALPALTFGPIGAAATDLFSRRKTLMITNLLQAITILAFWYFGDSSIFIIYAVVLMYSLFNQFYVPAEAAYLPSTVSHNKLSHANSLFFLTSQASVIFGFGFAGVIQNLLGFSGALLLSAGFLFAAFLSTTFLDEIKPSKTIPEKLDQALNTFFVSVTEGYKFIKENKQVLYPLLMLISIQVGLSVLIVSLPVVADQILGISAEYSGILIVVPAGLGAVLGSILVPRMLKMGFRKKKIIEMGLLIWTISSLILSIGIPFLPLFARLIVTLFVIIFFGIGFTSINIPTLTFLQTSTPNWLRGRVFGNMFFLVTILSIFPVIFSGTISEIFGIRTLLTIAAFIILSALIYSKKHGELMIKNDFKITTHE